jgi:hypothetical protein
MTYREVLPAPVERGQPPKEQVFLREQKYRVSDNFFSFTVPFRKADSSHEAHQQVSNAPIAGPKNASLFTATGTSLGSLSSPDPTDRVH